ncbi:MBL fold metallo-hydrolase, partial [Candidatus Acetothermia bacterium]|nr:MBL fold metallo-hydrolase [Candidatus Acetothermia bacterium]
MTDYSRSFRLGAATTTLINVGDGQVNLAEMLDVPASEWSPRYASSFDQPIRAPFQCVHLRLSAMSILVDASSYPLPDSPYAKFALPNYQPPPGLLAQLAEVGVNPEEVTHVVFTHWHWDHHSGATVERGGYYIPCFPNARHYLGRADWESEDTQKAMRDPNAMESRTLAVLHQRGLLDLVEGNHELCAGIQIIAAPGESPGHQIVRVHSEGRTLYCLGDLYH